MTAPRTTNGNGGVNGAVDNGLASSMLVFTPLAAVQNFRLSQRVALEAARFWAKRVHAYAEQLESLAKCAEPTEIVAVQAKFITRMQEDYASERETLTSLWRDEPHAGENI